MLVDAGYEAPGNARRKRQQGNAKMGLVRDSVIRPSTTAASPGRTLVGWRARTTVAITNGARSLNSCSTRTARSPSIMFRAPPFLLLALRPTRPGVQGMSMWRTPNGASASQTAFTIAGGEPTVADSPIPFAPSGWWGDGVTVWPVSHSGTSSAVGIR